MASSLSPLSNMSPATSDFLGPFFFFFFFPFFSLGFFIICTLFRVSWTSTDVRRCWAESGTFFSVKKTKSRRVQIFLKQYAGRAPFFTPLHVVAT